MKSILIIEDDPLVRKTLASQLGKKGFEVATADTGEGGVRTYGESSPDVVLLDLRLPDIDGLEVLRQIKERNRRAIILIMTAFDDMKTTVEAIKLGAFEYLVKPLNATELDLTIDKAFQVRALSGTGKELVAKAIHYNGLCRDEPFIVINCCAISDTLLESELFGHVKGAFTDAVSETKGKFEIAGKGTVFLDEVGDVSPNLQSKLLRIIETRDFMKVGGEKVLKTEARIIAATNQNLKGLIEKGKFREDLYYRLKVVEISLPPLRERREDIPDLVAYLLEKINRDLRRNVHKVPPEVMKLLVDIPWRGNVRELENALTRAVILAKGDVVLKENLPLEPDERRSFADELVPLEEVEKKYIQYVLSSVKGSKTRASQILQISRPTLDKKIREYGLDLGETS